MKCILTKSGLGLLHSSQVFSAKDKKQKHPCGHLKKRTLKKNQKMFMQNQRNNEILLKPLIFSLQDVRDDLIVLLLKLLPIDSILPSLVAISLAKVEHKFSNCHLI